MEVFSKARLGFLRHLARPQTMPSSQSLCKQYAYDNDNRQDDDDKAVVHTDEADAQPVLAKVPPGKGGDDQ